MGVAVGAGTEYVVVVVLFWASTPEASIRATRRREKITITMESLELTIVIAVLGEDLNDEASLAKLMMVVLC